jgi:phosphinothricin acetyltransferase
VRASTCTFQLEPTTLEERRAWFEGHSPLHPVTVAIEDGRVMGWGALSPFRERAAYRHSVESSVYVREGHHRRGLGRALLVDLLHRASALGHHTVLAGITADQPASLALHHAVGFVQVAHLREVGFKLGRWLDVLYLQRHVQH